MRCRRALANQLADRFFEEFRYRPSPVRGHVLAQLPRRHGARAPARGSDAIRASSSSSSCRSRRSGSTCLITGSNPTTGDAAVIVELKQWTEVGRSNITDCVTVAFGGGSQRDTLHPSRQVAQYQRYLQDTHPAFTDGAIDARRLRLPPQRHARPEVAALPRRRSRRSWRRTRRSRATRRTPSIDFLEARVVGPDDGSHPRSRRLDRLPAAQAPARPRRARHPQRARLHAPRRAAGRLQRDHGFGPRGRPEPAEGRLHRRRRARHREVGHRGQPRGRAVGARRSNAPRHRLEGVHGEPAQDRRHARRRDVQVLPRHRQRRRAARRRRSSTRRTASGRSAPAASRRRRRARASPRSTTSSTPAACPVFFIDDLQVVRPGEVGSTDLIREAAAKRSLEVREYELQAQFRSNGSDSFIQWVDNTLELDRTPQVLWPMDDDFDFRIVGSVEELEQMIRAQGRGGGDRAPRRRLLLAVVRPERRRPARPRRQGRGLVDALERQVRRSAASAPASRSRTSGRARRRGSTRSAASTPRRASSSTTSA